MDTPANNAAKLNAPGLGLVGGQTAVAAPKMGEVEDLVTRAQLAVSNLEQEADMLVNRLTNILPSQPRDSQATPLNVPSATPRITLLGGQLDSVVYKIDNIAGALRIVREQLEN